MVMNNTPDFRFEILSLPEIVKHYKAYHKHHFAEDWTIVHIKTYLKKILCDILYFSSHIEIKLEPERHREIISRLARSKTDVSFSLMISREEGCISENSRCAVYFNQ